MLIERLLVNYMSLPHNLRDIYSKSVSLNPVTFLYIFFYPELKELQKQSYDNALQALLCRIRKLLVLIL